MSWLACFLYGSCKRERNDIRAIDVPGIILENKTRPPAALLTAVA